MKKKILIPLIVIIILIVSICIILFIKIGIKNKAQKPTSSNNIVTKEYDIIDIETEEEKTENTNETNEEEQKIKEEEVTTTVDNKKNTNEDNKNKTNDKMSNSSTQINTIKTNEKTSQEEQKKNEPQIENKNENTQTEIENTQTTSKETPKVDEVNEEPEQEKIEEPVKEEKQLDLSKYDRYVKALNGGYQCFKKSETEIKRLRDLINTTINEFGYTNVLVIEDSSIINSRYFTANKTNVENLVYNSEDFAIHYYAETEYTVSATGEEHIIQTRSYITVEEQ